MTKHLDSLDSRLSCSAYEELFARILTPACRSMLYDTLLFSRVISEVISCCTIYQHFPRRLPNSSPPTTSQPLVALAKLGPPAGTLPNIGLMAISCMWPRLRGY